MNPITVKLIVGKDGRITIPSSIRDQHDIQQGDVLKVTSSGQGQVIILEVIK